jgi:hypothetical protein
MPNETEAMAFALIRLLRQPPEIRCNGEPSGGWMVPPTEPFALAADRGWLQRDDSGRVALTDAGREVAQALGRPLH